MRKPAFSKTFALTEAQRAGSGAWIFAGEWIDARKLKKCGWDHVLCIPPNEDALQCDFSLLRGMCVTVWHYFSIDFFELAARLRAFGVRDILFINRITCEWEIANTPETDAMIKSLKECA